MPSRDMGGMRGSGSSARGLGSFGKGGSKPSVSQYPKSNVRVTKAPLTKPRVTVKPTSPAKPVKANTSVKSAERAPMKSQSVPKSMRISEKVKAGKSPTYATFSTAKWDHVKGEAVWSKPRNVQIGSSKASKQSKSASPVKPSPKAKKK